VDESTVISGQIDRVLITDREILIVDYNTNRPPPGSAQDIPESYRQQLRAYRRLMEKIYPGRAVRTALIWTYTATLMEIRTDEGVHN
jgi:ATP-dependent helicase/nuclease subunit A